MGRRVAALAGVALLGLSACAPAPLARPTAPGGSPESGAVTSAAADPRTDTASPLVTGQASAAPVDECLARAEGLTAAERAGQLLMVGVATSGLDQSTADLIRRSKAGSVVLLGSTSPSLRGAANLSAAIGSLGSSDLPMLVAVDQEGGQVQRLKGEGFSRIPSAVEQGRLEPDELRELAAGWGEELRDAGVRYNLAPVADVVPEDKVRTNAPIGRLQRNYATEPAAAAESVVAFVEGMDEAGIATSLKHFPGLGEVVENTDFAAATDVDITVDDPAWEPFVEGMAAGASSVMVSSAVFEQIDPGVEAVFSERIITGILRGELGFDGVVIADDLGAAASVADIPPGERAVRFVRAGGDVVINADPRLAPQMATALVDEMEADEAFADRVSASAARVLGLKESLGLGSCS